MYQAFRTINAHIAATILKATGYRFSQIHRKTNTITYRLIDTVTANQIAGV